MKTAQEDRRIKRTKKLLKEALTDLLLERDLKQITVTDLVDRADLNRGTFYLHYRDIYDLLNEMADTLLHDFDRLVKEYFSMKSEGSSYTIGSKAFDYVYENQRICRALFLSPHGMHFIDEFKQIIIRRVLNQDPFKNNNKNHEPDQRLLYEYLSCFVAGGLVSILTAWLKDGKDLPKESVVSAIDRILYDVLTPDHLFARIQDSRALL